jgi:serine/threonine protein kinase
MVNRINQRLDKYRLILLLGRGSFSEVYLAEKVVGTGTSLVAIKILNMQPAKENLKIFLDEARKFHLSHPNILRIRDFGIADDTPFLVMDYAPNGTLRQRHPRGTQIPLPIVVTYVNLIADALQYIHDEGLIHRDIKPDNLLIGENNEILLGDFGITVTTPSLSIEPQSNGLAGTPNYMAPEQFLGQPSRASDQYALGVITYEWLTGYCPFQGSFLELMGQQLQVSPPLLSEKIPTITLAVSQVVQKALAKNPKQRFESVKEFAKALEHASKEKQTALSQTPPRLKGSPTINKRADLWLADGNAYRNAGKYRESLEAYNYALELNPNYTDGYYNRGLTYYYLKEYDSAISDFNQALFLNGKYALVYYCRGLVYQDLKKYDTAIADFDQVISLSPKFVEAYYNRGLIYSLLTDYRNAIKNFDEVIKLNPRHAMAYYNRGLANYYLNEFRQAVQNFDQALRIDSSLALASIAREAAKRMLRN